MKSPQTKSIYIDITSTLNTLHTTGIQRVVKKISAEFQNIDNKNIFFVKFCEDERYRKIDIDFSKITIDNNLVKMKILLKKIFKKSLPSFLLRLCLKIILFIKFIIKKSYYKINIKNNLVEVKKGDIFLMIDATWNYMPWAEIRRLKNNGAIISTVVYDLLPLKYPKLFTQELTDAFIIWTRMISYYSSNLYCISYTVKKDVQQFLLPLAGNRFSLVDVIKLGSDVISNKKNTRFNEVEHDNKYSPKFLSVGTLEPRKNYHFLLHAFNEIWSMPGNESVTWTIVGRVGWESNHLYTELKNHPEYGERLKLHTNVNDQYLMKFYKESTCVLAASIDEGYGLPVVEAIENGCTILLSKIEVFKEFELGKEYYFSIENTAELIKKILAEKNVETRLKMPNINSISWKEASELFYKKLIL